MQNLIKICRAHSMRRLLIGAGAAAGARLHAGPRAVYAGLHFRFGQGYGRRGDPNATVTLTSTEEGTVRTTTTNGVGDYHFEDVKAGHYSLVIAAPSFEKYQITGVPCWRFARNSV